MKAVPLKIMNFFLMKRKKLSFIEQSVQVFTYLIFCNTWESIHLNVVVIQDRHSGRSWVCFNEALITQNHFELFEIAF